MAVIVIKARGFGFHLLFDCQNHIAVLCCISSVLRSVQCGDHHPNQGAVRFIDSFCFIVLKLF